MYKKTSQFLTKHFVRKNLIAEDKADMYEYGFEVLLSTSVYILIFLLLSVLTRSLFVSLLFFVSFLAIRKTAGGFHASTYLKCHLLFFLTHCLFIVLNGLVPVGYLRLMSIFMIVISAVLVLVFAPVAHPNKPFIYNERKKFRRISFWYTIIASSLAIICFPFSADFANYYFAFSYGMASASIAMLVETIKQRKDKSHEEVFD